VFRGETVSDLLVSILEREPDWTLLPPHTPAGVRRLLARCLEKDPRRRLRDIGDARLELERSPPLELAVPAPGAPPRHAISRRAWLALVSVPAVAAFAAGRWWRPAPPPPPTYHRVTFRRGAIWSARFSPDGQTVLYSATWEGGANELYSTRSENPESRPLGQPDADVLSVSRSGELAILLQPTHRGGFRQGTLARVGSAGTSPRPIRENVVAADWGPGESLAMVRVVDGKYRLEFPPETVLHESAYRILGIRVAPDGRSVAFCGWGSVSLVDLEGQVRVLSSGWAVVYSVAWSPDGHEVWFSGSHLHSGRASAGVFAVSLSGRQRTVMQLPVGVLLHDRSREGRLLVTVGLGSKGIRYRERSTGKERDLSWLDWGLAADISVDGSTLLFSEGGTAGSSGRSVYVRRIDGSPAIRLGNGTATSLSPDGSTALALEDIGQIVSLVALPVGPGVSEVLTDDRYMCLGAKWFPDGRRVLVAARESGRPPRAWVLDRDRGSMDPVTPEGVAGIFVSPDGVWVLAGQPEWASPVAGALPSPAGLTHRLYPVAGGEPHTIPGLTAADEPVGWDRDGRHVYFRLDFQPDDLEMVSISRIDVHTGRRELWAEVVPEGVRAANWLPIAISSDGEALAYTYLRSLNNLHVVDGVT
jgi:Tol biopolymer transport system component